MNMKRSTWLIIIFALFLVGSTASVGQADPAVITTFTAFDKFDPSGLCFGGGVNKVGTVEETPTITCPGGELLAAPPPFVNPCTPGSRVHTRGYVITTEFITTESLVEGMSTITINANFDADGNGPAWGTISIKPDDVEGTWDGVWEGIRKKVDGVWIIPVHASLRGTGDLEGMHYKAVDTIMSPFFTVVCYTGDIDGRIIDPHP